MDFLKNVTTGAITDELDAQSEIYQRLVKQILPGSTTNKPAWEAVAEEDITASTARVAVALVPPIAAAASDTIAVDGAPLSEGGTIISAEYYPDGAIAGANTNSRTLLVTDGVTTKATLALVAGVNAPALSPTSFTINSAGVLGGDQLVVASNVVGTGIADPGGIVTIEFTLSA